MKKAEWARAAGVGGATGDGESSDVGEAADTRGELWSGLAADGSLRWAAADLTGPTRVACQRQDLSPLAAAALGRCMTAATLLQRMAIKTPSRLVLELAGNGPLKKVLGEVRLGGGVRGMVGEPRPDLPAKADGSLDVGRAIGSGLLKVWRLFARSSYQSHVELKTGGVGVALTHYLEQSEQTRSAALLGFLAVPSGIAASGGVLLEVLPGASESAVRLLEANFEAETVGPGRLLAQEGLGGLLGHALRGLSRVTLERVPLSYECRCSEARIGSYLSSLGDTDRAALAKPDGSLEAECVFCGTVYRFGSKDVEPEIVN